MAEQEKDGHMCYCGNPGEKRCGGCKSVYYCSQECQLNDWGKHKLVCRYNKPAQDSSTTTPKGGVQESITNFKSNSTIIEENNEEKKEIPRERVTLILKKSDDRGYPGFQSTPIMIEKNATIQAFTEQLCKKQLEGISISKIRLWLEVKAKRFSIETHGYGLLAEPELTFEQLEVQDGQKVMLEIKLPDDDWPVDKGVALELLDASNLAHSPPKNKVAPPRQEAELDSDEEEDQFQARMPTAFPGMRGFGMPPMRGFGMPGTDMRMGMDMRGMPMEMRMLMSMMGAGDGPRMHAKSAADKEAEELQRVLKLSLEEEEKRKEDERKKQEQEAKLKQEQDEIQQFYNTMKNSTSISQNAPTTTEFTEDDDLLAEDDFEEEFDDDEEGQEDEEEQEED